MGELDLSIKQAIDTKRLTGPLTKEQITKLIDIVYTPPQNVRSPWRDGVYIGEG